ncbi:MAG: hypothetical protein ACRCYU_08985 [Nocardioides sp.]
MAQRERTAIADLDVAATEPTGTPSGTLFRADVADFLAATVTGRRRGPATPQS